MHPGKEFTLQMIPAVFMLVGIGFIANSCKDQLSITDYTGWKHDCEAAGGVTYDGMCFDPSALVDMGDPQ